MIYKFRAHHWIAAASFVVLFLLLTITKPFLFVSGSVRWYHVLFFSFTTFLFYHKKLNFQYLGKYKKLYLLIFFIILLNLILNPNNFREIFGLAVAIISVLILVPFLSNPNARKVLFFTFIYIAAMKILLVYQFSSDEIFFGEMSGRGKDKNYIGMIFDMVLIMMISRTIITRYIKKTKVHILKNLVITVFIVFLLYSLLISGSRSAVLSLIFSIVIILYLVIAHFGVNTTLLRTIIIGSLVLIIGLGIYPKLIDKYYFIGENFARLVEFTSGGRDDISNRVILFYSGIEFIKEKPILGYGIGGEQRISEFNFHNTFFTFWVNFGIFGILFLILLIKYFWGEVKSQIRTLKRGKGNTYDFLLLIGLFPFFIMFLFLGITTLVFFMMSLLTSFTYERMRLTGLTHHR
jgi:O-antigen ligase